MKIAMTHPYSWPEVRRGAERVLAETSRSLAARGHDVTILTSGASASTTQVDRVQVIRFRRLFKGAVWHERWFAGRILPVLARGRFDVVHSLMPYDAAAAIVTRRIGGHRTVYQEVGIPERRFWAGLRDRHARSRVVRDADVFACMSQFALGVLESDWGRIGALIPGGVRLDEFAPAPERAPTPTVLFSAALTDPAKRLGLLLEAITLVATRVPDVRLWLSGPGDPSALLSEAPAEARARCKVLPLGRVEELAERYAHAWVTVLPTETDSFGLVLVESLACGTPIVATDRGAPPELITSGVGVTCSAGDPRSLADALVSAFELAERPTTAELCRARASEYDWDKAVAPLLEDLYAMEPAATHSSPAGS